MSRFAEKLGLYPYDDGGKPDPDTENERLMTLAKGVELFMRAGGSVSINDWADMDPQEQAVFAAVGDKLQVRQALAIATAARSVMGSATVMAVIDDGDELIRLHLTSLLDRMEKRPEA